MDGVEPGFLAQLNQYAEQPDLTVILTGEPGRSAKRAEDRGVYSRFHRGGTAARQAENRLYIETVQQLRKTGSAVLHHHVADEPAEAVADLVLRAVLERLEQRSGRCHDGAHQGVVRLVGAGGLDAQ